VSGCCCSIFGFFSQLPDIHDAGEIRVIAWAWCVGIKKIDIHASAKVLPHVQQVGTGRPSSHHHARLLQHSAAS
jgi:hypothetical protein